MITLRCSLCGTTQTVNWGEEAQIIIVECGDCVRERSQRRPDDPRSGRETMERTFPMGGLLGNATAHVSMPVRKAQTPGVCDGCGKRVNVLDGAFNCRHCGEKYWSCAPCNVNGGCVNCVGRRNVDAFMSGLAEGLAGVGPEPTAKDAAELSEWAQREGVEVRMWTQQERREREQ